MKRSLSEKVLYNQTQNTDFSRGYIKGVKFYQSYGKSGISLKSRKAWVDSMRATAKEVKYAKGFMCGFRDAADERKAKKK